MDCQHRSHTGPRVGWSSSSSQAAQHGANTTERIASTVVASPVSLADPAPSIDKVSIVKVAVPDRAARDKLVGLDLDLMESQPGSIDIMLHGSADGLTGSELTLESRRLALLGQREG